jgi:hypothetical protein
MHGARAWRDETNGARGEKIFSAGGRRLCFNGKGGEGALEGWTPHGGGVGERERERGGLAQRGAARRRGVGAAADR